MSRFQNPADRVRIFSLVSLIIVSLAIGFALLAKLIVNPVVGIPELRLYTLGSMLAIIISLIAYVPKPERLTPLQYCFLGLAIGITVLCLLSVWFSEHRLTALIRQLEVFAAVLSSVLMFQFFSTYRQYQWIPAVVLLGAFSLSAGVEWLNYLALENAHTINWLADNQLKGFYHIRHLGHFSAVAAVVALYLVFACRSWLKIAGLAFFFVAVAALFFSGGRAIIYSAIPVCLFIIGLNRRQGAYAILSGILLVLAFVMMLEVESKTQTVGLSRVTDIVREVKTPNTASASTSGFEVHDSGRSEIWRKTFGKTLEQPWLGMGPDGYIFMRPPLYGQSPHNMVLQFAIAWGWPVAILLLLAIGVYAIKALGSWWRTDYLKEPHFYWYCAFVLFVANGLVSSTFYQPVNMVLLSMMLGLGFRGELQPIEQSEDDTNEQVQVSALQVLTIVFVIGSVLAIQPAYRTVRIFGYSPVPAPDSFEMEFVQTYPYTFAGYQRWLQTWAQGHLAEMPDLAKIGAKHTEKLSWQYTAIESQFAGYLGDKQRADKAYVDAIEMCGGGLRCERMVNQVTGRKESKE